MRERSFWVASSRVLDRGTHFEIKGDTTIQNLNKMQADNGKREPITSILEEQQPQQETITMSEDAKQPASTKSSEQPAQLQPQPCDELHKRLACVGSAFDDASLSTLHVQHARCAVCPLAVQCVEVRLELIRSTVRGTQRMSGE